MSATFFESCLVDTRAKGFPEPYKGKVRDVYELKNDKLAIVVTDRISAFDHIMAEAIPFKGQILNRLAAYFMQKAASVMPVHLLSMPHPNVTIARKCEAVPVEIVVRGYLAGHAWRVYKDGGRTLCGAKLPDGLKQFDKLPSPILTPTTKAKKGHDEDISPDEILKKGLVTPERWKEIEAKALALFKMGTITAAEKGLILADTKYEFGIWNNELMLIDEVHTPDSSRYYYAESYEEAKKMGTQPEQLSKEFLREWLMSQGFSGQKGQKNPTLPEDVRLDVYNKYKILFELLTGETFTPVYTNNFETTLSEILSRE